MFNCISHGLQLYKQLKQQQQQQTSPIKENSDLGIKIMKSEGRKNEEVGE